MQDEGFPEDRVKSHSIPTPKAVSNRHMVPDQKCCSMMDRHTTYAFLLDMAVGVCTTVYRGQ